ncbi:hypothetical protein D3C87_2069430 [compost metagenome]
MADGADTLCDVVQDHLQLLVLPFKKLMQFEEIHPADIPVVVTGFGVKYKLIGEQLVQLVGDGLSMLVRYSDVGFHASLY